MPTRETPKSVSIGATGTMSLPRGGTFGSASWHIFCTRQRRNLMILILLWLLGVPLGLIILLWLLGLGR
jgi:hypothetical protein